MNKKVIFLFLFNLLYGFTNTVSAQTVEIPIQVIENILVMEGTINDTIKGLFILDSGSSHNLLSSSHIKEFNKVKMTSIEGAAATHNFHTTNVGKISFQDITFKNQEFILGDLSRLNEITGIPADGILGFTNIFSQYIIKVDYFNSEILLYKSLSNVKLTEYQKIPFDNSLYKNTPEITISFNLNSISSEYYGKVLFDTGANVTLLINSPYNKSYSLLENSHQSINTKSQGLVKSFIKSEIMASHLQIGDFSFEHIPISISHSTTGFSSNQEFMGILGSQIICRFDIIIDTKNKNLYLKPNSNYYHDFKIAMSGIQLLSQNDKIIIFFVDENSEAFKSGIREGDEIIFIDNFYCRDIQLYNELLNAEGKEILIGIRSSSGLFSIHYLWLRRRI